MWRAAAICTISSIKARFASTLGSFHVKLNSLAAACMFLNVFLYR